MEIDQKGKSTGHRYISSMATAGTIKLCTYPATLKWEIPFPSQSSLFLNAQYSYFLSYYFTYIFELLCKALCITIFCLDGKHRTGHWDLVTIWLLPSKLGRLFHGSQASYQTSCWAKCLNYNAMSTYCPKTRGLPTQPLELGVLSSPSHRVSSR